MSSTDPTAQDLADAAAVHAAREAVVQALGPLAASPLDQRAAETMRAALERVESPAVRRAIRRLARPGEPGPPRLVAVPRTPDVARQPLRRRAPAVPRRFAPLHATGGAA